MAIVCWGNLGKAANDNQRIEQSIQEYVEGHNENVNAHQVEGSSLYMHRIQEELDHKLGSIDLKYLSLNKRFLLTSFETLDGWTVDAYSSNSVIFGSDIATEPVDQDIARMTIEALVGGEVDYSKNPFFQTTVKISSSSDVVVYFGCGQNDDEDTYDKMGFKFINGTEYAWWSHDGAESTYEIPNVVTTNLNTFRAYIDSEANELYFYVNGVLVHTVTSDLPVISTPGVFEYFIQTQANSLKKIYFSDLLFMMDR